MLLTPLEQKAYYAVYEQEVFTLKDLENTLKNHKTAALIASRLNKKGYVQRIKKGLYCIKPIGSTGKPFALDKMKLASKLAKNYFLSHHTALELHGLAQSAYNTVYITTNERLEPLECQNAVYKRVYSDKFFGVQQTSRGINVSNVERTILDCISQIKYAGGLEELIKSIQNIPTIRFNTLYNYLGKYGKKNLYQKTGFILELLKEDLGVPDEFLKKLEKHVGERPVYLMEGKKSRYAKKWNLMAPSNTRELKKNA